MRENLRQPVNFSGGRSKTHTYRSGGRRRKIKPDCFGAKKQALLWDLNHNVIPIQRTLQLPCESRLFSSVTYFTQPPAASATARCWLDSRISRWGPEFFVRNFQGNQWSVEAAELLIGPDERVSQESPRHKGILSKPLRNCFRDEEK